MIEKEITAAAIPGLKSNGENGPGLFHATVLCTRKQVCRIQNEKTII